MTDEELYQMCLFPRKEDVVPLVKEVKRLKQENNELLNVLKKYAHCRHACEICSCTNDARAALYGKS